jgi:hypothetical protein
MLFIQNLNLRRLSAWLALFAVTTTPRSAAHANNQQASQSVTQALNSAGSAMSNMLGMTSIVSGTQNQRQGQADQNMAQTAMGAMQIAQGLLGLMAGAMGAQKANQAGGNASDLSGLGGYSASGLGGTSPTPGSANDGSGTTSSSSAIGVSSIANAGGAVAPSAVGISASDLRTGALGTALNGIEQAYGIPRDQFAAALQAGTSPQEILAHAPKSAPPMDMLNKIAAGLAANSDTSGDAAARVLASANAVGGVTNSFPSGDGLVELGKSALPRKHTYAESDIFDEIPAGNVSPAIKAAIAANNASQKAEKDRLEENGWNLFELVHSRYQKIEAMLYGRVERTNASPTAGQKGL